MSAVAVEDRRVADERPGSSHDRIEKQAGFVDQNEVGVGFVRFF